MLLFSSFGLLILLFSVDAIKETITFVLNIFGFIFMVVRWVIDLKMGTLPADIATISKELKVLALQISDLRGDMWTRDQMNDHIDAKIREHMEKCPHCHQH